MGASTFIRDSGPVTRWVTIFPPVAATNASTVPSPPSAMGHWSISIVESALRTPSAIARATCPAARHPLNLSGAMTIRMNDCRFERIVTAIANLRTHRKPVTDSGTDPCASVACPRASVAPAVWPFSSQSRTILCSRGFSYSTASATVSRSAGFGFGAMVYSRQIDWVAFSGEMNTSCLLFDYI